MLSINGNVLTVGGVDILDGTPLLDIKPYVPQFNAFPFARGGWLDLSKPAAIPRRMNRFSR